MTANAQIKFDILQEDDRKLMRFKAFIELKDIVIVLKRKQSLFTTNIYETCKNLVSKFQYLQIRGLFGVIEKIEKSSNE